MHLPYRFELVGGILQIEISEALTSADLSGLMRDMIGFENTLERMPNRILYLSGMVAFDLDYRAMDAVAAKRKHQVFSNPFRSAIVAPNAVSFGFARMFQTLNTNPQIEIRIFDDERAAMVWVSEPAEDRRHGSSAAHT